MERIARTEINYVGCLGSDPIPCASDPIRICLRELRGFEIDEGVRTDGWPLRSRCSLPPRERLQPFRQPQIFAGIDRAIDHGRDIAL